MAERTKYLTEATLFAPAASKWAADVGILNNNGGLLVVRANNNLSDLTDTVSARINLGVRIGADVQPYSERLTAYANGATPSSFSLSALTNINAGEWRTFIGAGTVSSVTVSGGTTGLLFLNGTTTTSGTSTLSGTLSVTHGGTGTTSLSALKTNLGINNVDNTADISKPISTAVQLALDSKFDKPIGSISQYVRGDGSLAPFPTSSTGTGTVTSVTVSGGTTGLSFNNGTITTSGTTTLTGTLSLVNGGTGVTTLSALKNLLSINNVNNTSDASKPISSATAVALDRRVRIPASMTAGATLELPTPESGKAIGWNTQGTALVNITAGSGTPSGTIYVTVDVFDSDGTSRVFTLSRDPGSINNIAVTVGGVSQTPTTDYTLAGAIITFTNAPPATEKIVIRSFNALVLDDLDASQISTGVFTGSIIPDDVNVQIALQALETAFGGKISGPISLGTLTLPEPEPGMVLGWNPSGTEIVNLESGSGVGDGTAVSYANIFTGDGSTTDFELNFIPRTLNDVSVSVGGVDQVPGEIYSITGANTLSFANPVPNGIRVIARYIKAVIIDDLLASDILTGNFTGVTIPNGSSIQQALQSLETAVETNGSSSGTGVARSHVDIFTGDGTTTRFPLSDNPSYLDNLFVEVGGIVQGPTTHYTWDENTNDLVMTSPVPLSETVVARYINALVINLDQFGIARVQKFISVTNQTDYILDYNPLSQNEVEISIGGIVQIPDDDFVLLSPNIIRFIPAPAGGLPILIRYGSHRSSGGGLDISRTDVFEGDGAQTQFVLTDPPESFDSISVTVGGYTLTPIKHYSWTTGRILTFTNAPDDGLDVVIKYGTASNNEEPLVVNVRENIFLGDGVVDSFPLSFDPMDIVNLFVSVGGLFNTPGDDYVLVDGTTVLFSTPPPDGEAVVIKFFQGTVQRPPSQANVDVFDGDGVQTTFVLSQDPVFLNNISVTVGGVDQVPIDAYTLDENLNLVFTEAPGDVKIIVRYLTTVVQVPTEVSKTFHDVFTGDGLTTVFTLSENPGALSNIDVTIGGLTQTPGVSYTWTSGTTLTFTEAPPTGLPIVVSYLTAVLLADLSAAAVSTGNFTGGIIPNGSTVQEALQAAATAISRIEIRSAEVVSASDFGVKANGIDDDTAAWNYAAANGAGKKVVFPNGTSRISGTINLVSDYFSIDAQGPAASSFLRVGDFGNTFLIRKPTPGTVLQTSLSGFSINSTTRPSFGSHIFAEAVNGLRLHDLDLNNPFIAMNMAGVYDGVFDDIKAVYQEGDATGRKGLVLEASSVPYGSGICANIAFNKIKINSIWNIGSFGSPGLDTALHITAIDGLWGTDFYFGSGAAPLVKFENSTGQYVTGIKLSNGWLDHSTSLLLQTIGSAAANFGDISIDSVRMFGGNRTTGIIELLGNLKDFIASSCQVNGSKGNLVNIGLTGDGGRIQFNGGSYRQPNDDDSGGVPFRIISGSGISLNGLQIDGSSPTISSAGIYAGGGTMISIIGCGIFNCANPIGFDAGSSNYSAIGNYGSGFTSPDINNYGTGSRIIAPNNFF